MEKLLGLKHSFGTVYHPQSQGKVERTNRNIKEKLGKVCAQTKMNWIDALPIIVMEIRSTVSSRTGFTPFELHTGQQFPGPGAGLGSRAPEEMMRYKPYFEQLTTLISAFSTQVRSEKMRGEPTTTHTAP